MGLTDERTFMIFEFSVTVNNATLGQIVGRDLGFNLIAGQELNLVHPHLAGEVSQNFVAVLQPDSEAGGGQQLAYLAVHLDELFAGRHVFVLGHTR